MRHHAIQPVVRALVATTIISRSAWTIRCPSHHARRDRQKCAKLFRSICKRGERHSARSPFFLHRQDARPHVLRPIDEVENRIAADRRRHTNVMRSPRPPRTGCDANWHTCRRVRATAMRSDFHDAGRRRVRRCDRRVRWSTAGAPRPPSCGRSSGVRAKPGLKRSDSESSARSPRRAAGQRAFFNIARGIDRRCAARREFHRVFADRCCQALRQRVDKRRQVRASAAARTCSTVALPRRRSNVGSDRIVNSTTSCDTKAN